MQEQYFIICDERQKSYFLQVAKSENFRFIVSESAFENIVADEVANYNLWFM
jgi:hypothetical protein